MLDLLHHRERASGSEFGAETIGRQMQRYRLPTNRGRGEMLSTSFRDYERRIRQQFTDMFASAGFDAQRDIAGIILNRWGHAYLSPQPGFFFGRDGQPAPREVLRRAPFGRIAFRAMRARLCASGSGFQVRYLVDNRLVKSARPDN